MKLAPFKTKKKSQIWTLDLVIGLVLFLSVIVFFYKYLYNVTESQSGRTADLAVDAKIISDNLLSNGFPKDWNLNTVKRIGIVDNYKVTESKLYELARINYESTKRIFGIRANYIFFFINPLTGKIYNFDGICGIGDPKAKPALNFSSAYYYNTESGSYSPILKDFVKNNYNSTIYCDNGDPGGICAGFPTSALQGNLSLGKFEILIMENARLVGGSTLLPVAENWARGDYGTNKVLIFDQALATPDPTNRLGVIIDRACGFGSVCPHNAIVNYTDPYFTFVLNENLAVPHPASIIPNPGASPTATNFTTIARYLSIIPDDGLINESAIAKWTYNSGKVYFVGDFDSDYLGKPDVIQEIRETVGKVFNERCTDINVINATRLIKIERFVNANSVQGDPNSPVQILKLVLYVWR